MWSEGVIGIPDAKDKAKYTKCHYWVKHYDETICNDLHFVDTWIYLLQ